MPVDLLHFRDAFALADAGLALLSPQGEWRAANPALCRMLQRPPEALLGTRAHESLFDAAGAQWLATLLATPGARELREVDGEGGRRWRITCTLLPPGGDADAPALLQVEDAGEARDRRRRDEAAARLQEYIAHGISHDLRAPLRGIAGFAAKLEKSGAVAGDEGRADLERIRASAARAERLVDELLELLNTARRPLREQDVDIGLLCEWVAAELQDADPARALALEIPPGLGAHGDEHAIKTLLHHVFDNAWKFSAGRERVEIAVEGAVEGGRLRLSIRDRGCGFDMRYADKLFLPFQRLHGAGQGGGNGLGLAIAQQIAERHDGRIWAQSQPGEGSTFFIELPAATGSTP